MKKLWMGLGKLLGLLIIGSTLITIISPVIIFEAKIVSVIWKYIFNLF